MQKFENIYINRSKSFPKTHIIIKCRQNHIAKSTFSIEKYQFGDHKAYYWLGFVTKHRVYYLGTLDKQICNDLGMEKINFDEIATLIQNELDTREILIDDAGGYTAIEIT
jgi:hypothetical protein